MQPARNRPRERNRSPAPDRTAQRARGQFTWLAFGVLLLLLIVPTLALYRLVGIFSAWQVLGALAALSALTYWTYAGDKRKAEAGAWRTPERTLHFLEFAGGWPAAFVAQRKLRHKISKGSYQSAFWLIIVLHQIVATDFVLNWKFSRLALGEELISELQGKPYSSVAKTPPPPPPPPRTPAIVAQQTMPVSVPRAIGGGTVRTQKPQPPPRTRIPKNNGKGRAQ